MAYREPLCNNHHQEMKLGLLEEMASAHMVVQLGPRWSGCYRQGAYLSKRVVLLYALVQWFWPSYLRTCMFLVFERIADLSAGTVDNL